MFTRLYNSRNVDGNNSDVATEVKSSNAVTNEELSAAMVASGGRVKRAATLS